MYPELTPIFESYEALRADADAVFARVDAAFPRRVKCRRGCADCCSALFDLPLVEAMYINRAFREAYPYGPERSRVLEKAADADRLLARIKKDLYRAEKNGESPAAIMEELSALRLPCPLLNDDNQCALYDHRPVACRLYGVPQEIGGRARVCGFSGFDKGENYPAARIEKFQERMEEMGAQIEKTLGSRFTLTDLYAPLSMALLTDYDDKFLGVGPADDK